MNQQNTPPGSILKHVELPPGLTARVNQLASRRGKEEAELVRASCLTMLQLMANKGTPLDKLSMAFAAVEADGARRLCHSPAEE